MGSDWKELNKVNLCHKINYNKLMTFNTMFMILVFLKLVSLCVQMLFVRGLQSGEECYQFKDDH